MRLQKCIYGLVDGPRMWYVDLRDTLVELGVAVSVFDESFFFLQKNDKPCGIIVIHVDDLLFGGLEIFIQEVIGALKTKFKLSMEVGTSFVYTGLDLSQSYRAIKISQLGYVNQVNRINIDQNKVKLNACPINDTERSQLRSVAGQLLWAATQSRPDIAYGTFIASNSYASGTIKDIKLVNKTISFMKKNPLSIWFPSLDLQHTAMVVFSDASFGNLAD